jgi:hypothetical protein
LSTIVTDHHFVKVTAPAQVPPLVQVLRHKPANPMQDLDVRETQKFRGQWPLRGITTFEAQALNQRMKK